MSEHNHITRDIKPLGQCPACDEYHDNHIPKGPRIEALEKALAAKDAELLDLKKSLNTALEKVSTLSTEVGYLKLELKEKDDVLSWYADESSWKTIKHCESDTISKIRTDASDYDSYGYSEYGEASRLMLVGGKRAREVIKKYRGSR